MLEKFFLWFVSFFGILSIFGIYLGYSHLIYAEVSMVVIVLSAVISYFLVRNNKSYKVRYSRGIILILLILLGLDVYVSLPYMVYPHSYVDFGLNVAQGRMIAQSHGFPSFSHVYPNISYGVFAIFNSIILHAYSVSSIIAIVMQIMTAFGIFFIGKELFDEKTGLIALFLYGFSLVNIMLLEQGYLTQNFATFFFVSSMYLAIMCPKNRSYLVPLVLSLVGLLSYPHYFAIMFISIIVYFRKLGVYLLAAIVVSLPEISGIVLHYLTHTAILLNSFVMFGGILVPNLFVLSVFVFAFFGYLKSFSNRNSVNLRLFTNMIVFGIFIFTLFFIVNFFLFPRFSTFEKNILQLYTVVKLLYLLFVPVSLFAALELKRFAGKRSGIVIVFLIIYSCFFAGYLLILPEKSNLPPEMYFISEPLGVLIRDNAVGFDGCMLQRSWVQPMIYDTLYGRPDNYTEFSLAEFGFLLQTQWAYNEVEDNSRTVEAIKLNFSRIDVDYFVTTCSRLDENVYYSLGSLAVYDMA